MDRRSFLKGLGLIVGGVAINEAIPFNRVWSFPKEIKINKFPGKFEELLKSGFQELFVNHYLTSSPAWYLQPKYIVVPPQLKSVAESILYA